MNGKTINAIMKHLHLLWLVPFTLVNCANPNPSKTEREGEPTIYYVADEDAEMNDAMEAANATLEKFDAALKSGNPDFTYFTLKMRFETSGGGEHIWIDDISWNGEGYYGVVGNVPHSTLGINLGDTITVPKDGISDWMYLDGQKAQGAFSIKLLRKRMTEQEREQFDLESGMIFEE